MPHQKLEKGFRVKYRLGLQTLKYLVSVSFKLAVRKVHDKCEPALKFKGSQP